jgi:Ca2+-binding EF-hand superfamily protein
MGSVFSGDVGLSPEDLQHLQSETGFSKANIRRLHHRFTHLDKEKKGYLVKKDMMTIPEVIFQFEE